MQQRAVKLNLRRGGAIVLDTHQCAEITDGAGLELTVAHGWVWLTQEADARDLVLSANESFRLDRNGLAVVQAFAPAQLRLSPALVDVRRSRTLRPSANDA
jgi:hypothetical protein